MTMAPDCNELHRHSRDAGVAFDAATHTYTVEGREFKSVTTLVDECFRPFDAPYWAARTAAREGTTAALVLERWEAEAARARDLGTAMHARIERHYLGLPPGDGGDADGDVMHLFRQFAAANPLRPYRTEWRIYHEGYDLAGTLDFLEQTPGGRYNIWDWKRSKKLVEADGRIISAPRCGAMGLHPVADVPDTAYWHYALQLSIYRYILEARYGIAVDGQRLGVFHPSYAHAWVIELPYMQPQVEALLAARRRTLDGIRTNHQ